MKSFLDRADRGNLTFYAQEEKTSCSNEYLQLQAHAFEQQQLGQIEAACDTFGKIHAQAISSYALAKSSNVAATASSSSCIAPSLDVIDSVTADYCQLLEICCRHGEALDLLRSTLDRHPMLPCPSLCSVLLLKILFTHPGSRTQECWEEMRCLLTQYHEAPSSAKKNFKKAYKSHFAYYIIVQQLFQRERRTFQQLQLIQHVDHKVTTCGSTQDGGKTSTRKNKGKGRGAIIATISTTTSTLPIMYVIGDSHIVSLSHRKICKHRTVPYVITGLKAWHVHRGKNFFTGANFLKAFQQLFGKKRDDNLNQSPYNIIISAGEIDCREGFWNTINKGMYKDEETAITGTVDAYVNRLSTVLEEYSTGIKKMYILPIYPYLKTCSKKEHHFFGRANTVKTWNRKLKEKIDTLPFNAVNHIQRKVSGGNDQKSEGGREEECTENEIKLQNSDGTIFSSSSTNSNDNDIIEGNKGRRRMVYLDLQLPDGPLDNALSLDGTHVNAKIIPYVERAIQNSLMEDEEM
jgi:hypothetical protein